VSLDDLAQSRWLARLVAEPRWTVRASTTTPQVLACLEGAGLTIRGSFIAARERGLVPVLPSLRPPDREVWLVSHQDLRKNARIAAVTEWLRLALQHLDDRPRLRR
jgi:DNA-binding transcriptional LysR family regulator